MKLTNFRAISPGQKLYQVVHLDDPNFLPFVRTLTMTGINWTIITLTDERGREYPFYLDRACLSIGRYSFRFLLYTDQKEAEEAARDIAKVLPSQGRSRQYSQTTQPINFFPLEVSIMSRTFFISDLHLGHENIYKVPFMTPEGKRMREFSSSLEADDFMVEQWNSVVGKRDTVYVLGDVAFGSKGLQRMGEMLGRKVLISGNHDGLETKEYLKYFVKVQGIRYMKKQGFILSHIPVHPSQLEEGRFTHNIHGHLHTFKLDDPHYVNVCVEQLNYTPINLRNLRRFLGKED